MVPDDEAMAPILGACQQGGRYFWATDLPCPPALKFLIGIGVVTFKGKRGVLAEYVPIVTSYGRFTFNRVKDGTCEAQ